MTIAVKLRKPVEAPKNNYQAGTASNLTNTLATIATFGTLFTLGADYVIMSKYVIRFFHFPIQIFARSIFYILQDWNT